jgi:hypothetical protein
VVSFSTSEPIGIGRGSSAAVSCVAFYEGINLDNGDPASYPGEYGANGAFLTCYAQGNPLPSIDITAIRPIENAPVVTGFTSKWQVTVDNVTPGALGPCKPPLGGVCTRPAQGTKVHLVFDRLPPGATLRRTTGAVVATDAVNLTFLIPP